MCDVFNCDLVCRFVALFDEQLHGVDLLLGLHGDLVCDRFSRHNVIITVATIEQLFVIVEDYCQ